MDEKNKNWKLKIKKKNFRITVHTKVIVDKPECAVHVPWTVQEALDLKKKEQEKKRPKTQKRENADADANLNKQNKH